MTIETDRLLLREILEDDFDAMAAYNRDPEARIYLLAGQGTEPAVRRWLAKAIAAAAMRPRMYFGLGVTLRESNTLIGVCGLSTRYDPQLSAALGWELDRRYWGRGYTTEAAGAIVDFGFRTLGVTCVTSDCFSANLASIRVMQKLGMRRHADGPLFELGLAIQYRQRRPIARHSVTSEEWFRLSK